MKYFVIVPPPKSKRMIENRQLLIYLEDGWDGCKQIINPVCNLGKTEIDVPEEYEWLFGTSKNDGSTFQVIVEYTNSTGSKKEMYNLVPEKVQ